MAETAKIWKVRIVKPYAGAHNHLIVGEVLHDTPTWLRLKGRTYHFGRTVERVSDIKVGSRAVRIVPWNRIELVNELPASFDYVNAKVVADGKGNISLKDARYACPIVVKYKGSD